MPEPTYESLRADFPRIANSKTIYLDNAATTHKPQVVLDAEAGFYKDFNANPYRSQHSAGRRATQIYETCRSIVAGAVGAHTDEIIFTRNTTEAINLLAYSWGLSALKAGDRIVLPIYEHHSNLVPWQMVAKRTGAELAFLYPNESGLFTTEEIARMVDEKTALISCAHISNVYACASPVDELARAARAVGARIFLDCAQSAAHTQLDFHKLGMDAAAFSGHKLYASMGIGVLYLRRELMQDLQPFLYGGEMIDDVHTAEATFQSGPRRFEAGTPNVAGAFSLACALDYLGQIGWQNINELESALMLRLIDGLKQIKGVDIIGAQDASARAGSLVSLDMRAFTVEDVALELDRAGLAVRAGTHCAQPLHRYLKLTGSLRISPCFYNTPAEIDRCLELLADVGKRIKSRLIASLP